MDRYLERRLPGAGPSSTIAPDDGPAWATILITGHLGTAPLMLIVVLGTRGLADGPRLRGVAALSLYLLPRLKGMFVALQWAKRGPAFGGPQGVAGA